MKKSVIICSGAKHLLPKLRSRGVPIGQSLVELFPDKELRQTFSHNSQIKGRHVFLVQSFLFDEKFFALGKFIVIQNVGVEGLAVRARLVFGSHAVADQDAGQGDVFLKPGADAQMSFVFGVV